MEDLYRKLQQDLEQYIRDHWIPDADVDEAGCGIKTGSGAEEPGNKDEKDAGYIEKGGRSDERPDAVSLEDLIGKVGKSFHEMLFERITQSGMTDVEVYKRADIDRKLFSKIRNNPAYHPRKDTVLALAIALKMNLAETEEFLARAEYALSPASKSDVIIRYFIERGVYDIHTINIALYEHGLPILE